MPLWGPNVGYRSSYRAVQQYSRHGQLYVIWVPEGEHNHWTEKFLAELVCPFEVVGKTMSVQEQGLNIYARSAGAPTPGLVILGKRFRKWGVVWGWLRALLTPVHPPPSRQHPFQTLPQCTQPWTPAIMPAAPSLLQSLRFFAPLRHFPAQYRIFLGAPPPRIPEPEKVIIRHQTKSNLQETANQPQMVLQKL